MLILERLADRRARENWHFALGCGNPLVFSVHQEQRAEASRRLPRAVAVTNARRERTIRDMDGYGRNSAPLRLASPLCRQTNFSMSNDSSSITPNPAVFTWRGLEISCGAPRPAWVRLGNRPTINHGPTPWSDKAIYTLPRSGSKADAWSSKSSA